MSWLTVLCKYANIYLLRVVHFKITSKAQGVENPSAVQETQETWAWSLSQEDPLEEEMANPLQNYCLKNPMDRGAWCTVTGSQRVRHDWACHDHIIIKLFSRKLTIISFNHLIFRSCSNLPIVKHIFCKYFKTKIK